MMSQEQNDLITKIGPGSAAGAVLRRYWQPAALAEELIGARPVVPVRLLGEDLVLFRDNEGELGLIQRQCPHRGADLAFGRCEDNGLRCPFHGWHFDRTGQCVEQPGEPEGGRNQQAHQREIVSASRAQRHDLRLYGPRRAAALAELRLLCGAGQSRLAFKGLWECNWLQALEVASIPRTPRFCTASCRMKIRINPMANNSATAPPIPNIPVARVFREYPRPEINVEETEYGLRIVSLRHLNNGRARARDQSDFAEAICIPMSNEMTITQWHVPIDDTKCYWYAMFTSFGAPVNKSLMREQRIKEHRLPDYAPLKNKRNNYGYDPDEQKKLTYTGMGLDINVHDQWAVKSWAPFRIARRSISARPTWRSQNTPHADQGDQGGAGRRGRRIADARQRGGPAWPARHRRHR